ncbi:MAG: hypothetical protein ACO1NS_15200 [Daejeonella sp.]|uniref:hypothetical protein n=1 Tax=Daejeonella sp. JGW-45 TaxID=3034148 RepID=UPI0023EAD74F|nr:hypothetical protein [Daejeonella sp. JGW-45]
MIEVFKTNVKGQDEAAWLVNLINSVFESYMVNFDLEDCDRIMRIKCDEAAIDSDSVIALLSYSGFTAEILEDNLA